MSGLKFGNSTCAFYSSKRDLNQTKTWFTCNSQSPGTQHHIHKYFNKCCVFFSRVRFIRIPSLSYSLTHSLSLSLFRFSIYVRLFGMLDTHYVLRKFITITPQFSQVSIEAHTKNMYRWAAREREREKGKNDGTAYYIYLKKISVIKNHQKKIRMNKFSQTSNEALWAVFDIKY